MVFQGAERAQSEQIGALLLFAVLIIAFSSYQAFVVPNQNSEIEFNHNQEVHSQFQDLRNAIVSVPGTSSSTSVSIQLGTRYLSRAVAQNPGPPTGSLRTNGTGDESKNVTISNAEASGETGDYWTGADRNFNSGTLVYSPNYNVYGQAPDTYYEHSVAYNQFREGTIFLSGQTLVDGREITLVTLNGSLSRTSSGTASVDVSPVSRSTQTVRVTNTTGSQLTISVLSRLTATQWEEDVLSEELTDGNVTDVSKTGERGPFNEITIAFEQGIEYRLKMAKAGVGTRVTDEHTRYLTDTEGDGTKLTQGESTELELEVRDQFNNPPANATDTTVYANASGGSLDSISATPDETGKASFTYTAPSGQTGTQTIKFSYVSSAAVNDSSFNASTTQNVSMTVEVGSAPSSGGGSSAYDVIWDSPETDNDNTILSGCSDTECTWDVGADSDDMLTLRAGTSPAIEGANIDFAVNNSTVGTVSPGENTTGSNGETFTDLTANANGTVGVYAASGGSSDVISITVRNVTTGNGGAAGTVTYGSGAGTTDSGAGFSFAVDTDGNSFTLQNASIDTSTMPNGTRDNLKNVNIDGTNRRTNNNNYLSDGTRQQLDSPTLNDGSTIEFRDFSQGGTNDPLVTGSYSFQSTEPTSGDYLTVTLGFSDGTEATLYFIPP